MFQMYNIVIHDFKGYSYYTILAIFPCAVQIYTCSLFILHTIVGTS